MAPSIVAERRSARPASGTAGIEAGSLPIVVPNRWQGEADCLVGPFSGRQVAAYFANRLVDFGQFEVFSMRVFPRRDAWFVEVRARAFGAAGEPAL